MIEIHPSKWPYSPYWALASFLRIRNGSFLWCGVVSPRPTPNLEDQVSVFMTLEDRLA
jgi:hypothetical protein